MGWGMPQAWGAGVDRATSSVWLDVPLVAGRVRFALLLHLCSHEWFCFAWLALGSGRGPVTPAVLGLPIRAAEVVRTSSLHSCPLWPGITSVGSLVRALTLAAPWFLVGRGTGPSRPAGPVSFSRAESTRLSRRGFFSCGGWQGGTLRGSSRDQRGREGLCCLHSPRAQQTRFGGSVPVSQEDPGEDSTEVGHRGPREEVESTLGNASSSGEEMGAGTGLSGEGSIQLKREEGIGGPPCCPWAGSQGGGCAGGESPSMLSRDPWEN